MNKADYDNERLAKMIADSDFTQETLADACNVARITISRAANGHSASYELLREIMRHLGGSVKDILRDESENSKKFANFVS